MSGGSRCPECNKVVYFAERQTGPDGKVWHRGCVIKNLQSKRKAPSTFESYPDQQRRQKEREARLAARKKAQEESGSLRQSTPSEPTPTEPVSDYSGSHTTTTGSHTTTTTTSNYPTTTPSQTTSTTPSQTTTTTSSNYSTNTPSTTTSGHTLNFCMDCGTPRNPSDAKYCWNCGFCLSVVG